MDSMHGAGFLVSSCTGLIPQRQASNLGIFISQGFGQLGVAFCLALYLWSKVGVLRCQHLSEAPGEMLNRFLPATLTNSDFTCRGWNSFHENTHTSG